MSANSLGRLRKVDLREAWVSESSHFIPWLAQEDNLKLLGEAIGMDLELESQEKDVGPFQMRFWTAFKDYMARSGRFVGCQTMHRVFAPIVKTLRSDALV